MVTRLVIINFGVFVLVNLVHFFIWLAMRGDAAASWVIFQNALTQLCMQGNGIALLWHPWTPLTSIFLHEGFGHFLGNTIALYLFGTIVSDLIGDRRVLPIYLLGGLFANLLYFISAQLSFLGVGYYALGASGAIMALAGTALILAPDYRVVLILLGEVKLKYIVLIMLLLDLIGLTTQSNTGGHAAHIGGFLMGCWFAYKLRDGKDLSEPVNRLLDRILGWFSVRKRAPKRRPQPAMTATRGGRAANNRSDASNISYQERLDAILDKIKASGYDSLTQEEKDFLYDASKK